MIPMMLILIGLTLFYVLFTNKTADILNALVTGTATPGGAPPATVSGPGQPPTNAPIPA